jgi:hypothetical protein
VWCTALRVVEGPGSGGGVNGGSGGTEAGSQLGHVVLCLSVCPHEYFRY